MRRAAGNGIRTIRKIYVGEGRGGRLQLQIERLEGYVLRSDQEFAGEGGFCGAPAQSLRRRDGCSVGIVIFLGHMGKDQIARSGVERLRVREIFADGVIRQVASAREHTLLDGPGVGANFQHVKIMIGFENQAVGFAQMHPDMIRHVPKIGADGHLRAIGPKCESHRVNSIVRNTESVDVDIADRKALPGLNGFHPLQALAEGLWKDAMQRLHGRRGHVKRGFPESEDLRKTVAVVGVFVGDQDGVEAVKFPAYGRETGQGFALSKAGVNEDAGAFGFEQRGVARAAGRKNGDAQTD
jgi:hypothetical protein